MENQPNKHEVKRDSDGRFLPGGTANPNGRPRKDCSITSLLKGEIDKVPLGEKKGRTWRQLLVLAWLTGAMKSAVLFKELLDRLEGKVSQPIEGVADGEPIKHVIEVYDKETKKELTEFLKG